MTTLIKIIRSFAFAAIIGVCLFLIYSVLDQMSMPLDQQNLIYMIWIGIVSILFLIGHELFLMKQHRQKEDLSFTKDDAQG